MYFKPMQVQQTNDSEETSTSTGCPPPTLAEIILLTPGAFCTPRSVIKYMTSRTRPKAEEVQEEMKKLEEVGLGEFHRFSSKESAFYKVIPEEDSRELTASVIGDK